MDRTDEERLMLVCWYVSLILHPNKGAFCLCIMRVAAVHAMYEWGYTRFTSKKKYVHTHVALQHGHVQMYCDAGRAGEHVALQHGHVQMY